MSRLPRLRGGAGPRGGANLHLGEDGGAVVGNDDPVLVLDHLVHALGAEAGPHRIGDSWGPAARQRARWVPRTGTVPRGAPSLAPCAAMMFDMRTSSPFPSSLNRSVLLSCFDMSTAALCGEGLVFKNRLG